MSPSKRGYRHIFFGYRFHLVLEDTFVVFHFPNCRTPAGLRRRVAHVELFLIGRLRLGFGQREGRVYQREVAERLREVAELSLVFRVVLLGEQSEIVAGRDHSVRIACERPLLCPSSDRPRRARTSRRGIRLPRRRARPPLPPVCSEAATHPGEARAPCASTVPTTRGSVAGKKPAQRDEEQARVQSRAPVVLREGVELGVEPLAAHLVEDGLPSRAQVVDGLVKTVLLGVSDRPIHRGPRRHLRGGERALRTRASPRCRGPAAATPWRRSARCP